MHPQNNKNLPPGIWDNPQPEDMQAYNEFTSAYLADERQYNKIYADYLNENNDDVLLRSLAYNYTETVGGGIKLNGSARQNSNVSIVTSGGIKLYGTYINTVTIEPSGGITAGGVAYNPRIYNEECNWKPVHTYPVYFQYDPDIWNHEWKCPIDVCQIEVICLGGGAGGDGGETSDRGGNGGGGAAYARAIRSVVPDEIYTIHCGRGGAGGGPNSQGENGYGSAFASYPAASGGGAYLGDNGVGGYDESYGDIVHRGGNGGIGDLLTSVGGGGGAAGGVSYDGSNGANGSDGGGGGDATTGGDGGAYATDGQAGSSGAGGGGGGGSDIMATPGTGGNGGDGFVTILDYTIFELAVRLGGSADNYLTTGSSSIFYEEMSGGIKANGIAVQKVYNNIAISGIVIVNGSATQKLYDIVEVSGGIKLNGTISISFIDVAETYGGIINNGSARLTNYSYSNMSGGLAINGNATTSIKYNPVVSGGISLNGSASRYFCYHEHMSGGIKLNNSARNIHIMSNIANGGLISSGSITYTSKYNTIIFGGIVAADSANISNAQKEYMSGGIILDGATNNIFIMSNSPSGGLVSSGSIAKTSLYETIIHGSAKLGGKSDPSNSQDETMSGGIYLAGSATMFQDYHLIMNDGLLLKGNSTITLIDQAETSGGINVIGLSDIESSGLHEEEMSGGILVNTISDVEATYNIDTAIGNWLEGWLHRKRITPHNIPATLNQFTLLVEFNDVDIAQTSQNNGYDIRFTASDGTTLLPFELTSFEIVDGIANGKFWVKTDLVPNSTFIYMYYGGSSLNNYTSTNAWSDDFIGVWHLDYPQGLTTMPDSTKNGNDAVGQPTPISEGIVNYAQNFDGEHDYYVSTPVINPNSLDFTYRCWVYVEDDTLYKSFPIWSGSHETNPEHELTAGYNISLGNTPWQVSICDGVNYSTINLSDQSIKNTWLYLSVVIDRQANQLRIYINETLVNTASIETLGQINGIEPLTFGAINLNGRYNRFKGLIDEVRISQVALTQQWINFEYLNISRFDNNLYWGSQELPYISATVNGESTPTTYFAEEPSGGLSFGGYAEQTHYMNVEIAEGISINGESTNYILHIVEPSGGTLHSCSADILWIAGFVIDGGIDLSGNADITYFDLYEMSGGILFGGYTYFTNDIFADGGIINGGTSRTRSYFADNMASYGGISNSATCLPDLTYNHNISGGSLLTGNSEYFYITEILISGGMLANSTCQYEHTKWIIADGGIKLGGLANRLNILQIISQSSGIQLGGESENMSHKVMMGGIKTSGVASTIISGQRYWVGTGANTDWNDVNNWSLSSGGTPGAPIPTFELDVFFDGNGLGDCSLNTSSAFANNIEMSQSYTGTFSAFRNSVNITGNAILSGSTINMGSDIWTVGGDFDISLANNVNCETSILHMTGSNKQIFANGFSLFDLIIDNGSIIDCDSMVINNSLNVYGTLNVNGIISFYAGSDARIYSTGTVSGNNYLEFLDNSIGITTYTGNLLIGIRLYNGPTIVPGTYPAYVMFTNTGTNTLYCGFYTFADLRLQSFGGNKTINIKTNNIQVTNLTISSTNILTINNKSDWAILGDVSVSGTVNWITNNKRISITGNSNRTLDFEDLTIDNLYINSYGNVTFTSGVHPLSFEAYRGVVDFNGQLIETVNDFTFWYMADVAELSGTTIIVGRNGSWIGHPTHILNLDSAGDWTFSVIGSAVAFNVQVSHSDASAGTTVHAYTSTDNNDNHNWLFAYVFSESSKGGLKLNGGINVGDEAHAYSTEDCNDLSYKCRIPQQDELCLSGLYYRNYGSYVFNRFRNLESQDICGTNITETTSDCSIGMVAPIILCRQLSALQSANDQETQVVALSLPAPAPVPVPEIQLLPKTNVPLSTPQVTNLIKAKPVVKEITNRQPLGEIPAHLRRNPRPTKEKVRLVGKAF